MGLDLRIYPEYGKNTNSSFSMLDFDRDSHLFNEISVLGEDKAIEVGRVGLSCYNDKGFSKIEYDAYGNRLKSVYAYELASIMDSCGVEYTNRAISEYLRYLPKETQIFLYWH